MDSVELMPLRIIERMGFVLRNNRKVAGEWLVYERSALPVPCPWVASAVLDSMLDHSKGTGAVRIEDYKVVALHGRLPEGVTIEAIRRAACELDG